MTSTWFPLNFHIVTPHECSITYPLILEIAIHTVTFDSRESANYESAVILEIGSVKWQINFACKHGPYGRSEII